MALERTRVWHCLSEPEVLRRCVPGLESLEPAGPDRLAAVLEVALPAVTGRFEGSVEFLERDEPSLLRIKLAGQGRVGFVNGEARLELADEAPGTRVHYLADVEVGGQVARLGQRMLSGVAREMVGQFFEALAREASSPGRAEPTGVRPGRLRALLQLVWRTLLNLLGRSRRS